MPSAISILSFIIRLSPLKGEILADRSKNRISPVSRDDNKVRYNIKMIQKPDLKIRIHSRLNKSRANGPGTRAVIWLQGCPFDCPGCFNPGLRDFNGGEAVPVEEITEWILSLKGIDGVSISGGEPTEQVQPLTTFLSTIRKSSDLTVLLFSGRTEKEIQKLTGGKELLDLIDVLIEGPYNMERANPPGMWPSSANQRIRFLTDRYNRDDFSGLPETEIIITDQGDVVEIGLGVMGNV